MSPSPIAEGFWIWKKKGPEDIAVEDGPNWIKVPGYDIAGEGDVHHIGGWNAKYSISDLKKMVIEKGWSGVTLSKPA